MDNLREGVCFGGPLHGEIQSSRFPKGFVLIDKPANKCWIYEWSDKSSSFTVRNETPMEIDKEKRFKAAEEPHYDVIAASWVGV